MASPEISIVVPVYNSTTTLPALYQGVKATMEAEGLTYELIYVMDGGKPVTWEVLLKLKKHDPDHIKLIRLSRNYGQHAATLCGINDASGNYIVTIDDDLQCRPEDIPSLLNKLREEDVEIVYAVFPQKAHSWFRNLGSRFVKSIFRKLVHGIKDGSSYRLMNRALADKIKVHDEPFVYIDQLISWYTLDVDYVKVPHHRRSEGKSGYNTLKLFRLALNMIFHYTDIPLRLVTWTGLVSSVISFILGIFFILQKIVVGAELGFTALIVSIFFGSSIILLSLGIVGEYIGRIYVTGTKKPIYSVRAKL